MHIFNVHTLTNVLQCHASKNDVASLSSAAEGINLYRAEESELLKYDKHKLEFSSGSSVEPNLTKTFSTLSCI